MKRTVIAFQTLIFAEREVQAIMRIIANIKKISKESTTKLIEIKFTKLRKNIIKKNSILISVKNSSYYSENKSIIKEKLNKKHTDYFKLTHSKERIELFSRMCKEGPIFVCIICERCLYKRSVKPFDQKNMFLNLKILIIGKKICISF